MVASRSRASAGFFGLVRVSIICLFIFRSNEVLAWQSASASGMAKTSITDTTSHHNPSADGPVIQSSPRRRELLFLVPKMAATAATATVMLPHRAYAAPPGGMSADSARDQWRNVSPALDDLLQNWTTEKWAAEVGGGDAIRAKLGTMGGTSSPLFRIEKAFGALRDSDYVDDFIEFQDSADGFMDALFQADSLANSSNVKTGSGSQTPPAVFIEQSRAEVVKMQSIAKKMNAMVK